MRRGKKQLVDIDSLKGDELDLALAEAIIEFQEKNERALKEWCAPHCFKFIHSTHCMRSLPGMWLMIA